MSPEAVVFTAKGSKRGIFGIVHEMFGLRKGGQIFTEYSNPAGKGIVTEPNPFRLSCT